MGRDNSIQAVAILFAEKGFFSHLRLEKKKAEFEASFCANLKRKHNSINNVPPKRVALGERGNVHYSQSLTEDTNPFPHQDPNAIDAEVDDVGGGSGGNEEFRDDNDNDARSAEDDEGESKMDYASDGPVIPEEAGAKMKSEQQKRSHHSRYKELENSLAEFMYAEMLPEGHPGCGCRRKVLNQLYGNLRLGE